MKKDADRTTERIAAFIPGASPPAVTTAIFCIFKMSLLNVIEMVGKERNKINLKVTVGKEIPYPNTSIHLFMNIIFVVSKMCQVFSHQVNQKIGIL
ncbi:MAG: hypothetical protein RBG13Loki_2716 [Promethearchaeota archaeon CR_4]|nr:MAG: hypothetical protein RBG13Loki_2716 [Candidatus Lokiarchaeota archaeon CR_4]